MTVNPGSSGTETLDAELWIYERLITDTVLDGLGLGRRVYEGLAPADAPFPFIVYQWQGGLDISVLSTMGSGRLMSPQTYLIKLIAETPQVSVIKPFLDRIDGLMDVGVAEQRITLTDGSIWQSVFSSRRTEPFSQDETDGGRVWYHRGGIYEVMVQSFLVHEEQE